MPALAHLLSQVVFTLQIDAIRTSGLNYAYTNGTTGRAPFEQDPKYAMLQR